jgi:hypothetical protein
VKGDTDNEHDWKSEIDAALVYVQRCCAWRCFAQAWKVVCGGQDFRRGIAG